MSDEGWSRALVAASGVALPGSVDPALRALVHEARAARLTGRRIEQLAAHRSPHVREAVAGRPDCPVALQSALVHDRARGVRVALAANPGLAAPLARVLARDREAAVLKALARSESAPPEVLQSLARHRREEVAHLARRALASSATAQELRPAPGPSDPQEPGAGREAAEPREESAASSPVGARQPRVLAPRPTAWRAAPPGRGRAHRA